MESGSIIGILRSVPETAALKPGDRLNVKVLEVFENQRALVDLGRFRALADIAFPVAAGDELRVRVQQTEGQLRLQLLPASGPAAPEAAGAGGPARAASAAALQTVHVHIEQLSGAMQRLPNAPQLPAEFRQMVEALGIFLKPLDAGSRPEALARKLGEFCEDSGLFLEHRLAGAVKRTDGEAGGKSAPECGSAGGSERILATDLKSRLLFLKAFFQSEVGRQLIRDSREAAGLAGAAGELLADIRAGQEQLTQPAGASHPFQMVHFDLPMAGERCQAELKIAYARRAGGRRDEGYRAAILLELDQMGAVRADLILQGHRLNVSVFVSNARMRDLVNRHAPEVQHALAPFFEHVTFQVSVSSRKIAGFLSEDWRSAGETQVDVRV